MKIVKNSSLSIVIILIVLMGLSKVYDFALKQNVNEKAAYVQKSNIDAQILIHGPCEPLWMISPEQLDAITGVSSYNLALSHSDFADNYLHLYLYLKNNKAPLAMFLYVTPESMDPNYNTFNTYRFAPYLNDEVVAETVKECDPSYYRWQRFPFMKYAYYGNKINFEALQGLKHWSEKREIPHYPDGFEPPLQVVWDNHLEEFNKLYPKGYEFKWEELRVKYLIKIIELAQKNKISVYLYESPVLAEALPMQPNRGVIVARIDSLAASHGIKYLRFEGMEIAKSRRYFMSVLNTNTEGSRIFTDSLGQYIKNEVLTRESDEQNK